jgi:hypothetical protein
MKIREMWLLKDSRGKMFIVDRSLFIGILGIFGLIILLAGSYLFIKENYVVDISGGSSLVLYLLSPSSCM